MNENIWKTAFVILLIIIIIAAGIFAEVKLREKQFEVIRNESYFQGMNDAFISIASQQTQTGNILIMNETGVDIKNIREICGVE